MTDEHDAKADKWEALQDNEELSEEILVDDIETDVEENVVGADKLVHELEKAKADAKQHFDKMMLLQAEMQNLQRRTEKDVANAHKYALKHFVDALLPILDSLEHAINAAKNDGQTATLEGIELTHKMFIDTLAKFKVQRVGHIGEKFNPELHEAMGMQADDSAESNTILQVYQAGYTLNERLVRPARVIVAQ